MHIVFVSSVFGGGSGVSQRQLARRLAQRGHTVEILAATERSRFLRPFYERQVDLSSRLRTSRVRPALLALQRPIGRRLSVLPTEDHRTWTSVVPEHGYQTLARRARPDVVVASSIERVSWRRLRAVVRRAGIPNVLYLREASALGHLTISHAPPDLLLANARSHADAARDLGYECEVVPSVVEFERAETRSARTSVLVVNPIRLLGGDRIWGVAAARRDIPFVLQESGLMAADERAELHRVAAGHPNVTVRPFSSDPASVFRDARILVVPHRVDNRPRVVLEAQVNGIPVIASDHPGLVESVGPGGRIVADTDDPVPWAQAIGAVWDDAEVCGRLADAATAHARRDEVSPDAITARFEELIGALVRTHAGARDA